MLSNIHLVDEDDMYSGFGREDIAPALDTTALEYDERFQQAVGVGNFNNVKYLSAFFSFPRFGRVMARDLQHREE